MSRLMMRGMVAIALVAVTVSTASAQERERGGRRGFGGGGFGGGGAAGLLAMPEVQKEIGISEADVTKLTEELRALRPERAAGGNREDFRSLSEEQRNARREEMRKQMAEIGKKTDEKIKATLTEAQYKRLNELRIQREGVGALGREDVAEKLKLTTEQKEQIAKLQEESRPQFGRNRGEGGNEGERPARPNLEEMRARRDKLNADVVALLTPEQKTAWESMQGAKFEFPAPNFGGPGGGRTRGNRPAAE